jgi:hypothetical protein
LCVPPDRAARVSDALGHLEAAVDGPTLAPSGELTGRRAQVRELLTVAIDEVAEALGGECTRLLRGTGSAAEVRAGVEELSGLLELLERAEGD